GGKYPDLEEAIAVARVVNAIPLEEKRHLDELAEQADVARRKVRIVLTLLKRHGMMREHRGGVWERTAPDVTAADLSRELTDYEDRRRKDRAKLEEMVRYCRTARCRTRMIRDYFGEPAEGDLACGHCDNDANERSRAPEGERRLEAVQVPVIAVADEDESPALAIGEEVAHATFGEGMVLAVHGDRVEVDFAGHGTRTVRIDFLRPVH
ncbi:MAG TPA: RecQ family zinc-binding domain-containing protein, partial [Longimicrobiaceae bacterium]|nr:RecQ family zinc-binding domain-containing protein [Longimicrobiaceae bacterium]